MAYVAREYWLKHGKSYKDEFRYNKKYRLQEQTLIQYMSSHIFEDSRNKQMRVLELGCGFGRITKLVLSNFGSCIEEYLAVDLSAEQVENAKHYVVTDMDGKQKYDSVLNFIVTDVRSFDISGKEKYFDLVLSSEMLMHIPVCDIENVMKKLVNLSKKNVINVDWYQDPAPGRVASHNFIHHYEKIYRNIPLVKEVSQTPIFKKGLISNIDVKQSIFHAIV
jgi:SAM-dependent methyltransferase